MSSSVISVPNALTFLRFLGIPLFIYLTLNLEADGWAIVVLAIGGATDYFDGKITLDFAIEEIKKNTRRFAKRQMTWFKRNAQIQWFDFQTPLSNILSQIEIHEK